jgi:hypothetical protein
VLTASSKELMAFLAKYGSDTNAFSQEFVLSFLRVK